MKNKKDLIVILGMILFGLFLMFLITPTHHIFGSKTDWLSQHIAIADVVRVRFYETHDLFMDFLPQLGGGQNVYQISYYGLFRPDILVSLFLPSIAMKDIIITGMVVNTLLSVVLCYKWLRSHTYSITISTCVSILLLCSAPLLFHSHRQVMFVNYMPWLFLGLIALDRMHQQKRGQSYLIIAVIGMITNSYFYSVSALLILFLYEASWQIHTKKWRQIKSWVSNCYPFVIGIFVCGILLIPTMMAMIEGKRSGHGIDVLSLFLPNFQLDSLLYDPYGAGFTMIVWIGMVLGWKHPNIQQRRLSYILTLVFLIPFLAFVMNGGLYARAKILIVFLPFISLYMAMFLKNFKETKFSYFMLLGISMPLIACIVAKDIPMFLWIDTVFAIITCFLLYVEKPKQAMTMMVVVAFGSCIFVNQEENFVSKKLYQSIYQPSKQALLSKYVDKESRFEDFTNSMNNSNVIQDSEMLKPTYYSSIHNADYNHYFYDVIKNPMSVRNRVAMVASNNVFSQGMMGSRYIFTNHSLPTGYQAIKKIPQGVLAENKQVMPIAYASSDCISRTAFSKLTYPHNLDVLYNHVVVGNDAYTKPIQSLMTKIDVPFTFQNNKHLKITNEQDKTIVKADKTNSVQVPLHTAFTSDDILLIQFDIEPIKVDPSRNVSITMNGIKNTLSSKKALYPNGNKTFHYTISSNQAYQTLNMKFTKGMYAIKNMHSYTLKYDVIAKHALEVDKMNIQDTHGKEVLKGNIQVKQDGYFVTSLPYQKGYEVKVDGHKQKPEKVNTAFLGFPITQGKHEVVISFHAPGKNIGWILSITGISSWIILTLVRRIYERKKRNL